MRHTLLAALGTALLLAGCADALQSYASQMGGSPTHPIEHDCTSKASASALFGYDADTSSLSRVLEEPTARRTAVQGCGWEKGTRVTFGAAPTSIAAGPISQQR
jgi:hypothetical protein